MSRSAPLKDLNGEWSITYTDVPDKSQQVRAVGFYTFARILIGIALLIWIAFSIRNDTDVEIGSFFQFYLGACLFLLMGATAALSQKYGSESWFVWSQFVFDAMFISVMIASGNSSQNPFLVLYGVNILAAVSLDAPRGVIFVTIMDVVAYTTVQVSGYLGLLNWEMQPNLLYFYIKVISEMFGLLLIGGLSFAMARQQALTRLRLREEQKKSKLMQQMHTNVLNELPMAIFLMRDQEIIPQNQNAIDVEDLFLEHFRSGQNIIKERWVLPRHREDQPQLEVRCVSLSGGGDLILIEDVTNLRRMEAVALQEDRLAVVGRLAASLAHEIRNPLASLSGAVQLMEESEESRLHKIILREVNRINDLIELFLQSARPTQLNRTYTYLGPTIDEIMEAFQLDPRCATVELKHRYVDCADEMLFVDLIQIRQILWNLLLNSVQAMPNGGDITLETELIDGYYRLTVEDTGEGIAQERLVKIFDPFYTTRAGGTGLGLSTVDRIVRAHNGFVSVDSKVGKGTTFQINIPLSDTQYASAQDINR